jgi:hypothetical protein
MYYPYVGDPLRLGFDFRFTKSVTGNNTILRFGLYNGQRQHGYRG